MAIEQSKKLSAGLRHELFLDLNYHLRGPPTSITQVEGTGKEHKFRLAHRPGKRPRGKMFTGCNKGYRIQGSSA